MSLTSGLWAGLAIGWNSALDQTSSRFQLGGPVGGHESASISRDSQGRDGRQEKNHLSEIQARIGMLKSRLEEAPPDGGRASKPQQVGKSAQ